MVHLELVTRWNCQEVLKLNVQESQRRFVPSVAASMGKMHSRPDGDYYTYQPLCIYNEKNTLVGFVMLTFDASTDWSYWFNGFLIDERYQGKGYGKSAVAALINFVKGQFPQSRCLNLTVHSENRKALTLYKKAGFVETGEVYGDELGYQLVFR